MPLRSWLPFLSVTLSLLALIHGFIFLHLRPLLPEGTARAALAAALLFLGTAYIAGRMLEDVSPSLAVPFLHVGSWWLGFMTYLFLGCLLLDVLLLLYLVLPHPPMDLVAWCRGYFAALGVIIATALVAGHLNLQFPTTRTLTIPSTTNLRIAVASDLHLCALVSPVRLARIIEQINALQPDLILLPGDIVDEDLTRGPRGEIFRALLKSLQAPLGVIAVTGNHEWISGVDKSVAWEESCGIRVLRDRAVDLGPCVVAGREDVAGSRFGGGQGVPLDRILAGIDRSKPLIVLDHQPVRIQEAVDARADLLLCGHTHHGQFWPFQLITENMFPVSHGHKQFDKTHVDVSCGAGAWGPQVRTSSRSEIVLITLEK